MTGTKPALSTAVLLCASLLLLAGCGAPAIQDSFLRPDIDLGFIERIAVPPFENHATDKYAGARLRDITITRLLMRGDFTVVDKGIVDNAIAEEALKPGGPMGADTIKRLGQALGVQALLLGTVDELSEERQGGTVSPRLTCTLRLVDTAAGTILWQAAGSRSGATMGSKLFGTAARDAFQVGRELIAALLDTLPARPSRERPQGPEPATAK